MLPLLLLLACERDPTLFGFWEVAAMRAGSDDASLEEVTLAGTMEFTAEQECAAIFSYTWSGSWQPDPRPEVLVLTTDAEENEDFVDSYKEKGETYQVSLWLNNSEEGRNTFDLLDWAGSTVTLRSESALPPGAWQQGASGSRVIWELELER